MLSRRGPSMSLKSISSLASRGTLFSTFGPICAPRKLSPLNPGLGHCTHVPLHALDKKKGSMPRPCTAVEH